MSLEGTQVQQQPDFLSPQDLINSLNPSEAPVTGNDQPAVPETIGGIPRDQFLGALKEVGVEVPDVNLLKEWQSASGQVGTLQKQVQEMEARLKLDPYHSPLSRSIDTMLREGKTAADIKSFVELATLQVDQLSPVDAITRHYALSKPGYTPEQIDALIERDLGFNPKSEEALTALQEVTLLEKKDAALAFLKQQQVSTENPEAVAAARAQQESAQRVVETWNAVIPSLKPNFKTEFAAGENKVEFEFQPSSEALEFARKAIAQEVAANPLAYPPNTETAKALQSMMENMVIISDPQSYRNAVFQHAYAVATQEAAQRYSGNGAPLQRNNGQQQPDLSRAGQATQRTPAQWIAD